MLRTIDFETHLIGKHSIFPKPVCLSTYDGTRAFLYRKSDIEGFLAEKLQHSFIIAHHATFECGVIIIHYPELTQLVFNALDEGRIYCTKIAEQLNNILRKQPINSLSLSNLVKHYFSTDISASKGADAWRLRYSELEEVKVWPQEAIDYAIDDSIWAYKLYQIQDKQPQRLCTQAAVYLNLMGSIGIDLDLERVQQLKKEVIHHLQPHYDFLFNQGLCVVQRNGQYKKEVKKLQEYVDSLNVRKVYTNKGQISVKAEALDFYKQQLDDPVLHSFSLLSLYEKVLSSYVSRMQESPIYSQYSAVKNTGRTSANGTNLFPSINIQQLPRKVTNVTYDLRNCFVPPEGFKILSIDYGGLELCSTAHQLYTLYGKSAMREVLNEGAEPVDMHSRLGAKIKKIPYKEFIDNKVQYKDIRQLAKPINLGFPGGLGYDTMRSILWKDGIKTEFKILHTERSKRELYYYLHSLCRVDIRIARLAKNEYALVKDELISLKRDFLDLYPELDLFLKETHRKFLTGEIKYVKNDYGEWEEEPMYAYEVAGFKRDWCTYTALCNGYLMQTPSAIGAKKAVSKIVRTYWHHPDVIPLAFIHDEILFAIREARTDLVPDLAYIMIDEMKSVLSSVRITVEASMSDQWQKSEGFWTQKYWR